MTISVSTLSCSRWMPSSACCGASRPRSENGFVTTPIVSAPASFATSATIGDAPVPVPPPMPAVTKTISAPRTRLEQLVCGSPRPRAGRATGRRRRRGPSSAGRRCGSSPRPASAASACASVFTATNCTPGDLLRDHAVDGVAAAAADADDLDRRQPVVYACVSSSCLPSRASSRRSSPAVSSSNIDRLPCSAGSTRHRRPFASGWPRGVPRSACDAASSLPSHASLAASEPVAPALSRTRRRRIARRLRPAFDADARPRPLLSPSAHAPPCCESSARHGPRDHPHPRPAVLLRSHASRLCTLRTAYSGSSTCAQFPAASTCRRGPATPATAGATRSPPPRAPPTAAGRRSSRTPGRAACRSARAGRAARRRAPASPSPARPAGRCPASFALPPVSTMPAEMMSSLHGALHLRRHHLEDLLHARLDDLAQPPPRLRLRALRAERLERDLFVASTMLGMAWPHLRFASSAAWYGARRPMTMSRVTWLPPTGSTAVW